MKSLVSMLCFVVLSVGVNAQAPPIQWQKSLGGSALDVGSYVIQNPDSTYVTVGTSGSNNFDVSGNHGGYDVWVVKLSTTGGIVWQTSIGGSDADYGNFIQRTTDGGYIVAGASKSNDGDLSGNHGGYDCMVLKLSSTGSIVWQKLLGGSGQDMAHCIRQTSDGGYILAGSSESIDGDVTANHGDDDCWVVKLTSTGGITWQRSYGGSGHDDASAVWETPDGNFFVAGNSNSNDGDITGAHGDHDYWVLKISATGSIIWQKSLGGTGDESICEHSAAAGMQGTPDTGLIIAGWSNSNDGDVTGNHGSYDYWVVKLSSAGNITWQRSFGGTGDDEATCLHRTADSGYVIGGTSYSNDGDVSGNNSGYDYWAVKVTSGGTLQWQKCMGGTGAAPGDCANSIQQTMDNGYILTGFSNANDSDVSGNHGDYDFWVVKLSCLFRDPGTISGPSALCVGASITLTDTASAGTWSTTSGNATVSGGVVTGVSAGTDVISYSVSNSCGAASASHPVTVNPLPVAAITVSGTTMSTPSGYSTYQWVLSGTPVSGATNAVYTTTVSGTYTVIVTDVNGCTATSAPRSFPATGINGTYPGNGLSILPNPTTGTLYITSASKANIKVFNTMGQLIKEATYTDNISISEFPAGIYFVNIFDEQGTLLLREKINKQ